MKIEKIIHRGYTEWENARKKGLIFTQLFGKYQYIYSSEKGKISLIELKNYPGEGDDFWEIYCLSGGLFDDTERFKTVKDAEKRIKEML